MIRLKRLYAHNFKQLQEIELRFPDAARVLVQGKNEAGKSTLFEAVFFALFGAPLVTEAGARGIEDLIAYGVEKARVELDLSCDNRTFKIARTIVRGKANVWELDVERDGQACEEIRGNNAVNKRLIAELGFDGESLLNTCFVEQKKLEKLEGLNRSKREESLAKLLNLDALVEMENSFKIRAEDKQELERLKKRVELADIQTELPACENELVSIEGKLKLVDLRRAVEGAAAEARAVKQLDAEICDLIAKRDAAAERLERMDALKEAMLRVRDARNVAQSIAEGMSEIQRLETEQSTARHLAEQGLPLQTRARSLQRLAGFLGRLEPIRAAQARGADRVAELTSAQARWLELAATIEREEQMLLHLEAQQRNYEIGEVLGEWIATRGAIVDPGEIQSRVKAKEAERDRLSQQFRREVYGLSALLLAFVLGAILAPALLVGFIGLAVLTLVVLSVRVMLLWRESGRAAEALGQAQGEVRLREATNEMQTAKLKQVEAKLAQFNIPVPETADLAQSRRVEIARAMENKTLEELHAAQEPTRERLMHARVLLGELSQQSALGQPPPRASLESLQGNLNTSQRLSQKAEGILARRQPQVESLAQALGVALDVNEIQRSLYQVDAQLQQLERHAQEVDRLAQEITRRQEQVQTLLERAREGYVQGRVLKTDSPEWSAALTVDDYNALGKWLRSEYDAMGGEAAIRAARQVEGDLGRRQGERESRARNAAALITRTQELLGEIGQGALLAQVPELEELEELRERFQTVDLGDEAVLRVQQREHVGRVHSLQDRQRQLDQDLGLAGTTLDPQACHAEYQDKAREALVRERGVQIVSLARRRIVQKVLPATMDYMRRILPTLTLDRYHDAQLDNESYKIQVWDERAGGVFKEKNIFSGGTKDQFSLALRLAFALATLPQERGTAPSFIFLDEPLGSFDQERAEALIYLLTEGEIARAFDQVFLISHVHVDERLFSHRVVLENGRVAFTDLPSERAAEDGIAAAAG